MQKLEFITPLSRLKSLAPRGRAGSTPAPGARNDAASEFFQPGELFSWVVNPSRKLGLWSFRVFPFTAVPNASGTKPPRKLCGLIRLESCRLSERIRRVSSRDVNTFMHRYSSLNLPLKISIWPFSIGLPGRMNSPLTSWLPGHASRLCREIRSRSPYATALAVGRSFSAAPAPGLTCLFCNILIRKP